MSGFWQLQRSPSGTTTVTWWFGASPKMRTFPTEAEARAWLNKKLRKHEKKKATR